MHSILGISQIRCSIEFPKRFEVATWLQIVCEFEVEQLCYGSLIYCVFDVEIQEFRALKLEYASVAQSFSGSYSPVLYNRWTSEEPAWGGPIASLPWYLSIEVIRGVQV